MERLCHSREVQLPQMRHCKELPADLEEFHATLRRQEPSVAKVRSYNDLRYHGWMEGLEWDHEYYGAKKSWSQGWANEKGGEVRINASHLLRDRFMF